MTQSTVSGGSNVLSSSGTVGYEIFEIVSADIPNNTADPDNTENKKRSIRVFGYGINLI